MKKFSWISPIVGFTEKKHEKEISAQQSMSRALTIEVSFMQERARIKWLQDGDRNTSFLHKVVKSKWARNAIRSMFIGGNLCWDPSTVKEHIKS